MFCPKCNREMTAGVCSLIGAGPVPMLSFTFTPEEDVGKRFFERDPISKTTIQGYKAEAHYCKSCDIILPTIQ